MKTLLCAFALLFLIARVDAAELELDGDLTWEITEPRCTFKLNGNLKSNTPGGSGTLRLVLWATSRPFRSPGFIVGEYTLGSIGNGFQFSDFTVQTVSKLPPISGNYYFTIVVAENTPDGWRNRLAVATGTRELNAGNFTDQKKWAYPATAVTRPLSIIQPLDIITLRLKATELLNLFPSDSQLKTTLTVQSDTKLVARNSLGKRTPDYEYKVVAATYRNQKVRAGRLTLDYPSSAGHPKSTVVLTFFFQGGSRGTYKSEETNSSGTEITWGRFSM